MLSSPPQVPDDTVSAPRGSAWEVGTAFLKLGLTSFGGPIAHLGYFHREFVERRRWLDEEAFLREAARGTSFCTWLRELSGADDEVSVDGGALQRLSTLLRESGDRVRLCADVLSMTFAET